MEKRETQWFLVVCESGGGIGGVVALSVERSVALN